MSVLSIFKNVKVCLKYLVPIAILIACVLNNAHCGGHKNSDTDDVEYEKLPNCNENIIQDRETSHRNIFVTTLDGRLSTIDILKGSLQWSIATEPGELLSSSIHRLELTSNGKYVRMIPSLSGGIYKFDGESIEAIPVTAEDLLKSSFKFSDDMVISGGTEVRTYGVNTRTGSLRYEYSMAGKQRNLSDQLDDDSKSEDSLLDDTLILKRHTQTVRAIEPRTGDMRWNFSIGHHELELMSNDNCQGSKNIEQEKILLDLDLRVVVPEGMICAYDKKMPSKILWKYKFESPVVSVFRMNLKSQRLESIDLFKNVNWLWQGTSFKPSIDAEVTPSLYLGMYQQQLYIQESSLLQDSIDHHKQLEHNLISDETSLPKIPFKPLPANNNEIIIGLIEGDSSGDGNQELTNKERTELAKIDNQLNAQAVLYASQYADGKGFYFFTELQINQSMQCSKKTRSTVPVNPKELNNITFKNHGLLTKSSTLWDYWKEILVIALTTAFVVNFMLSTRRKENGIVYVTVPYGKEAIEFEEEERHKKEIEELKKEVEIKKRSLSESQSYDPYQHYVSRFLTDFDLIQCLGKGGFGVVFEAKNKLDDCHYAIKRILLPSKKESRDRVLREVKTLAHCEHRNIVRYFHAWIEQPPHGWQETKDKELLSKDIFSTSITIDSPSPTEESKAFLPPYVSQSNEPWKFNFNDMSSINNIPKKDFLQTDDSTSFIQFKAESDEDDEDEPEEEINQSNEKGSSKNGIEDDSSFQIVFENSSKDSLSNVPSDTSHVISFRCTDDEDSTTNGGKKHRRNVSVDISELSALKAIRPISLVPSTSSTKVYLYIQMQLCMKNSLKDWLISSDLVKREGSTLNIWRQIIEAVHYVHLKGLIHRDLKPSNIFFALDGQIKIGDFGLVTDMAEIPIDPQTSSSNSNSSANFEFDFTKNSGKEHTRRVGTSLYMSPEQGRGLTYNYKVDIFSLGLILYELLNFFGTESERIRTLECIRKQNFPSQFIEDHNDEYELLKLMLSKKPEERPTTFGVLSRPPLNRIDKEFENWHFELPTRRKESQSSQNSLSK